MIELQNITKRYKNRTIIDNISFSVNDGEFVCIIGPSGCGKTTILKMINRLINPTSGKILIDGKDTSKIDEIELRRNIGYVIQQTGLFPHMTIKQNIELIPKLKNKKDPTINQKVDDLLKMVGLDESYKDQYPVQLSGGQQQRVGVARAFSSDPSIILMDEPFSALDPITRVQLQDELISLQYKVKKTIIFVTHDMAEAIKLADKICIVHEGKIQQFDTPENILKHPANDFVLNFVGKKRIWDSPELIRVSDVMVTNPITCNENLRALKVLNIMFNHNVDSVIVTNTNHEYLGVASAKKAADPENKDKWVTDIMDLHHPIVKPDDSIVDILNIANEKNIYLMPVVDSNSKLVGLITKSTLVTTLSRKYDESEGVGL
jgi:osmoprotectant transport system ATP-binding protein